MSKLQSIKLTDKLQNIFIKLKKHNGYVFDLLLEAISMEPHIGPVLKKLIEQITKRGEYSQSEKNKEMQWSWLLHSVAGMSASIEILIKDLEQQSEWPTPDDISSILSAANRISKKTADAKKRRLLQQAIVNAFDSELYRQGIVLRLMKLLEDLQYGEIELLERILSAEADADREFGIFKHSKSSTGRESKINQAIIEARKAKVIFKGHSISADSLLLDHLETLEDFGLIYFNDESVTVPNERVRRILIATHLSKIKEYELDSNTTLNTINIFRNPQITELGFSMLNLLKKDEVYFTLDIEE